MLLKMLRFGMINLKISLDNIIKGRIKLKYNILMAKFDPKYISAIVILAVSIGKLFGFEIGSAGLTEWLSSLIIVVSGIIIAYKSFKEGKLNIFGAKQ